ncbi:MAG TPA: PEP-CTERM sorting domain-containing protein [Bryobacteraceae bacterium]|nr:PEP-CTERM sorting domain-containing protein [Bryobacteraceae bacterium]
MKLVRVALLLGSFCLLALAQGEFNDTANVPAVPEPSMVVLMAAGVAGIGIAAWRRNRKS